MLMVALVLAVIGLVALVVAVVTNNESEFALVPGLRWENWAA